jgi:dienelactone hydrolase
VLTELGYVTLILDSFRPRSLFSVCKTPLRIASPAMRALDAHGALAYLSKLAFVDPGRIGLAGWSHGGIAALGAVNQFGIAHNLPQRFRAVVAFYPYCIADRSYQMPILILMGDSDDWTPVGICRQLQSRSSKQGIAIELVTYPGAFHGFDVPELKQGWSVEAADGQDHWLKYDKKAHEDAMTRVKSFLAKHLLQR